LSPKRLPLWVQYIAMFHKVDDRIESNMDYDLYRGYEDPDIGLMIQDVDYWCYDATGDKLIGMQFEFIDTERSTKCPPVTVKAIADPESTWLIEKPYRRAGYISRYNHNRYPSCELRGLVGV